MTEDYGSGPFCVHWHGPDDCDEVCAHCGHLCGRHRDDGCVESVERDGRHIPCPCPGWLDQSPPKKERQGT